MTLADAACVHRVLHAFQFRNPEVQPRFGQSCKPTALVSMPKASVNENDFLLTLEDDVRAAWKATVVQSIAIEKLTDVPPFPAWRPLT